MNLSYPHDVHNILRGRNGQASAEFLLTVPFLFIFILGGLEFTNIFVQAQKIASLSREVTSASYRDCSLLTGEDLSVCVAKVINGTDIPETVLGANQYASVIIQDFASVMKDGNGKNKTRGRIIVKVYTWAYGGSPGAGTLTLSAYETSVPETVDSSYPYLAGFTSQYPLSTVDSYLSGTTAVKAWFGMLQPVITGTNGNEQGYQNVIFTGEVFYQYKPVTMLGFLLNPIIPKRFYEPVVY